MLRLVDTDFPQALRVFHDLLLSEEEEQMENREEVWDLLTNEHYLPRQEVARTLLCSLAGEDEDKKRRVIPCRTNPYFSRLWSAQNLID